MERLFCVTVYIFNKEGSESLFLNHRKLGKWMPPGGKIDPNELPDDAAKRECWEETGTHIQLLGEQTPIEGGLLRPYGMQSNIIIPGIREHIDFIYLATADRTEQLTVNKIETEGVMWIPVSSILDTDFNTFDSVKYWIQRLSQELSTMKLISS